MHLRKFKALLWGVVFFSPVLFSEMAAAESAEIAVAESRKIVIPSEQLSAFLVAYKAFSKGKKDIKEFDVSIEHLKEGYVVWFFPHRAPGQMRFGLDARYVISLDGKIVKVSYGR